MQSGVCDSLSDYGVGARLEPSIAFTIIQDRSWALRALRSNYGTARTKRIEIEVTAGAPLTICMGRPAYFTSPDIARVDWPPQLAYRLGGETVTIPILGCLRVFEESTNAGAGKQCAAGVRSASPGEASRSAPQPADTFVSGVSYPLELTCSGERTLAQAAMTTLHASTG